MNNRVYECDKCAFWAGTKEELDAHTLIVHSEEEDDDEDYG